MAILALINHMLEQESRNLFTGFFSQKVNSCSALWWETFAAAARQRLRVLVRRHFPAGLLWVPRCKAWQKDSMSQPLWCSLGRHDSSFAALCSLASGKCQCPREKVLFNLTRARSCKGSAFQNWWCALDSGHSYSRRIGHIPASFYKLDFAFHNYFRYLTSKLRKSSLTHCYRKSPLAPLCGRGVLWGKCRMTDLLWSVS